MSCFAHKVLGKRGVSGIIPSTSMMHHQRMQDSHGTTVSLTTVQSRQEIQEVEGPMRKCVTAVAYDHREGN